MRNKNYRNIRSALRIPSVRGYGGCAFDGDVCRRHPVVRHGDGVVLRFSYESVFVYPITKKTRPYRGEAEIGRGEGRPSASKAPRSAIGYAQGRAEDLPSASQASRSAIGCAQGRAEDRPSASQASRSAIGCAQGRAEGRPSASQARNRAPIFRERLLEEALRDETAKCFINIKKERCTERVIDDRTTTIREAICIGSQYSSSTAHSCVNK